MKKKLIFLTFLSLLTIGSVSAREKQCNYYSDSEEYKVICDINIDTSVDPSCRIYKNQTHAMGDSFSIANWDAYVTGKSYNFSTAGDPDKYYTAGFRWSGKELYEKYGCPKYAMLAYAGNYTDFSHNTSLIVTNAKGDLNSFYDSEYYENQEYLKNSSQLWFKTLNMEHETVEQRIASCEKDITSYETQLNTKYEELKSNPETLSSFQSTLGPADAKVCSCALDANNEVLKKYLETRERIVNDFNSKSSGGSHIQTIKEVCPTYGTASEEIQDAIDGGYLKDQVDVNSVCGVFGEKSWPLVKGAFTFLKILAPILVIIFGMMDFLRVLFSGEDKDMKAAWQRFIKRIIAAVILILLPILISFILDLAGISEDCLQKIL